MTAEKKSNAKKWQIMTTVLVLLFVSTLTAFAIYVNETKDGFDRGWNAATTLQRANDYFLGDDDPHLTTATYNNGSRVLLEPYAYTIRLDAGDGNAYSRGEVTLGNHFNDLKQFFYPTSNVNIHAIHNQGDWDQEVVYMDPVSQKLIKLDDKAFNRTDTIYFDYWKEYELQTDVPQDDCYDIDYDFTPGESDVSPFQAAVDACNEQSGDVYVSEIWVNGEVAYSFDPIKLERLAGGPEGAMGYSPDIFIRLRGVSPGLDKAYFEFPEGYSIDENGRWVDEASPIGQFSIDSDGKVEPAEFPDDMVTIVFD